MEEIEFDKIIWSAANSIGVGDLNTLVTICEQNISLIEAKLFSGKNLAHIAAAKGNLGCLTFLIELGVDVWKEDLFGFTALSEAVVNGSVCCVEELLKYTNKNCFDLEYLKKALLFAKGNSTIITLLQSEIQSNKSLNQDNTVQKGSSTINTILESEIQSNGEGDIVKKLSSKTKTVVFENLTELTKEEYLNYIFNNRDMLSAQLCMAARIGWLEGTTYLSKLITEVSGLGKAILNYPLLHDESTPLISACRSQNYSIAKLLIQSGANMNVIDRFGKSPLNYTENNTELTQLLLKSGADDNYSLASKTTSNTLIVGLGSKLCEAADHGDLELIQKLVNEDGINLNTGDYDKRTPLHLAACGGFYDVVEYLLENKAQANVVDRWGNTPLSEALYAGHLKVVQLILEYGGEIGVAAVSTAAKLSFFNAVRTGDFQKVKSMIQGGVDNNLDNFDIASTILNSVSDRRVSDKNEDEIFQKILQNFKKSTSSSTGDKKGKYSSLYDAAAAGSLTELMGLVNDGVNVHEADYDNRTALHIAASEGMFEIVRFLIAHGAPVNVQDRWGGTPYSDAIKFCHFACAQEIANAGGKMGLGAGNDSMWRVSPDEIKFLKKKAEGFQGATWKAEWKGLTVAVKKLKTDVADPEVWQLFNNEIELLTRVRHPNLVMFLGACVDKIEDPILIEEYMLGGSIQHLLDHHHVRQSRISKMKLFKYIHDIALGVNYLHSYNPPIVHRDLTPSNLLLNKYRDNVKVADFGFGKEVPGLDNEVYKMTGGLGSYRYMAPEVLNHKDYNCKVDVYSFAMVVSYMLTGTRPFASIAPDVASEQVKVDPSFRPYLGGSTNLNNKEAKALKAIIQQCWQHNTNDRIPMKEVLTALEQFEHIYFSEKNDKCSVM